MRLLPLARVLAAAALLAAPVAARAQFAVQTDLASFLAATTKAGTDSFDDLLGGVAAGPLARTAGSFGYTASVNTTDFYATGDGADGWLSTNTATDVITFHGFAPTVRGIGGFFFGTDASSLFRAGTTLTVRAVNAGGTTTETLVAATPGAFLGFVSVGEITALTVEVTRQPTDLAWPTVNDLVLAEVSAVPEPATVVLLATGVVAVAAVARRRRAA